MPRPTALLDPQVARTDRGSVSRCPCCGDFDLRFDGVGVTLSPTQLRRMRRTLAAVCAEAERLAAPWGWALRTETQRQAVVFHLVGDDADALGDLLDAAVAALDLDALLLDTLGPRPTA